MTDITKCSGENCPNREQCFRYMAPNGKWQSYFVEVPYDFVAKCCHHFWRLTDPILNKLKDIAETEKRRG